MNNYLLLHINCTEEMRDILIAELADTGFEGFIENEQGFDAYLPEDAYNAHATQQVFDQYHIDPAMITQKTVAQENWNARWESSFEPVILDNSIRIRAPFHEAGSGFKHELVIQPKTSFGTGHHETTASIMQLMLDTDFIGKTVFDYGSGTGILAILASQLGAQQVFAIDIDEWAAENILENAALNNIGNIQFVKGNLSVMRQQQYDVILANINKNILLQSFESLSRLAKPGAPILISGFYENDEAVLLKEAAAFGLNPVNKKVMNTWCALVLVKQG